MSSKTVLVIGANGYIGYAVACAFVRAKYQTLGTVRSHLNGPRLWEQDVIPLIGSASTKKGILEQVSAYTKTLDVIVSTTEQWPDYVSHFNETVDLIKELSEVSVAAGVRPLVIFSSGCKDYGPGELDGAPGCEPHTETSPLNAPAMLAPRTKHAAKFLDLADTFDATVTRPTNVHGGSSSYYGIFIELAKRASERNGRLVFPGDPRTIAHSVHVDDCGEAYVALAEHPKRSEIAGQVFNISPGQKYETLEQIADALTKAYDLKHKIQCQAPPPSEVAMASALMAWSQWVGSEKIRRITGWKDTRPMFAEGISTYKEEYEEAVRKRDENVSRVMARFGNTLDSMVQDGE